MSLWHLNTVAPCMSYLDNGACVPSPGPSTGMNKWLLTCPRHYKQSLLEVYNFFYEPGNDRIIAHVMLSETYWGYGKDIVRYEFNAEDGAWLNQAEVLAKQDSIYHEQPWYTKAANMGSFNKIYARNTANFDIREVTWESGSGVSGGWSVNLYTWNPKSIYNYAVVNRIDNLLAGAAAWTLDCWRTISTTPERFGQLRLPNVLNYLAYESRNYCWVITQDGVICKADYQIPRWEMMSTVQNPEADALKYFITYDTKRKRVVVFRQRPDAADGACQHQLEFYYPMVSAGQLTQPVPVTSLRAGNRIILAAHIIGDAGEGMTPYTVEGELAAPVDGRLITPFSGTELNGRVCFQYQAPDEACTDTLQLAVTVQESL